MSIESRSNQYGNVFEHWQIKELLGQGSGGKSAVFRLIRNDSSWGETCALKVINLIEERGRLEELPKYRKDEYISAMQECSQNAEQEVRLMATLRGNTNVVDYLDYKFVDWSDDSGFGRDMLIRMELLKDLRGVLRSGKLFCEDEVIKLGRDICTALVLCHNKNILHRDLKPENIFRNEDGNYKLGDFGVSKIMSAAPMSMASTGIGTPEYAAPEQFSGKHDKRVDIYSLGLVLYELSNQNKLPFASSTYVRQEEVQKRQLGMQLPAPSNASDALTKVILKACAFRPEDRYQTAQEFLLALNDLSGAGAFPPVYHSVDSYSTVAAQKSYATQPAAAPKKRKSKWGVWVGIGLLIAAVILILLLLKSCDGKSPTDNTDHKSQASEDNPTEPQITVPGLEYSVQNDGTIVITGYTGNATTIKIPSTIDGKKVTSIGNFAFRDCYSLTNITISDSVTTIGEGAFYGCAGLTSVKIPDSVTSIGFSVFRGCIKLTDITIPDSVTTIEGWAFLGCISLTSITVPDSVTSIGTGAFDGCNSLTAIRVDDGNPKYRSDSRGVLFSKDLSIIVQAPGALSGSYSIPDSVTSIGDSAFWGCSSLTSITIPDSVTTVGNSAFSNCAGLTSITIPNSVISIGDQVFFYCDSLTNITISNSVTNIGYRVFLGCESLTSITIPDSVTSIGTGAFEDCDSLISITIPDSVTAVGDYAFSSCDSLTSVTIGDGVTNIDYRAFADCSNLTSITIPDSVTSIDASVFYCCSSLISITIPDSVTTIGWSAFYGCDSLTTVTIPDSVTSIGNEAFYGCDSLTTVTIPDSVTSISDSAFEYCYELDTVYFQSEAQKEKFKDLFSGCKLIVRGTAEPPAANSDYSYKSLGNGNVEITGYTGSDSILNIPSTINGYKVTTIGSYAFFGCDSLTSITIPDSVTSIGDQAFNVCTSLTSVTIGDGVTSIGNSAFLNCDSLTSITIPDSVTSIGDSAFGVTAIYVENGNPKYSSDSRGVLFNKNQSILISAPHVISDSYAIPDSVTSIGKGAFSLCESLTSVTIPDSVTSIGDYAFRNCRNLFSITIPNSVISVGDVAFEGCESLMDVIIGNGVTSIGIFTFRKCYSLQNITIPENVTRIGNYGFEHCNSLTNITIPDSVTTIEEGAFSACGLTSIKIPDSVITIGGAAFKECESLREVFIGNGVTNIDDYAFQLCTSLTSVTIPDSVTSIGYYAFSDCNSLTSITIPDSVTTIGDHAFSYCDKLSTVYFESEVQKEKLKDHFPGCTLIVQ